MNPTLYFDLKCLTKSNGGWNKPLYAFNGLRIDFQREQISKFYFREIE